jgi:hypothetical protein
VVGELLIAVQVYVLSTPTASEGLADDSVRVSPMGEVTVRRTVGAICACVGVAVQGANNTGAAAAMMFESILLREEVISKSPLLFLEIV